MEIQAPRQPRRQAKTRTTKRTGPRNIAVPGGKAVERIRLFDLQRGLDPIRVQDGMVQPPQPRKTKSTPATERGKRAGKSVEKTTRSKIQRVPYLGAYKKKLELGRRLRRPPSWEFLGPSFIPKGQTYGKGGNNRPPVSGRISGIAVCPRNPRRILISAAGGGIWESQDTGRNWQPRTDFQPTLSMGAIAIAPSNPDIVYAGTGEGDIVSRLGVGLLVSNDGGTSWDLRSSAALTGIGVYDIAVDPDDARHLLVATWASLLESRNGGRGWVTHRRERTWDLSINPSNSSEIFAACADGLYRSVSGGQSWRRVNIANWPAGDLARMEVCHAPSDGNVVYVFAAIGGRAYLWRRARAGGGFTRQPTPRGLKVTQAWYDWCAAVAPDDPDTLYLGAIHLYKGVRRRRGRWRWRNISSRRIGDSIHPDQHFITFGPKNADVVYIGNDGGIFRSPDGGEKWRALNKGLGITEFEYLAQHPTDLTWIIGGTQDNGTLRNGKNGTWNQVAFGDGGDCGVNISKPKTCYHSFFGMGMARSTTGGGWRSWTRIGPNTNVERLFYPPLEVRRNVVVQGGASVFISNNSGNNWERVDLPPQPNARHVASAILIKGANEILVGTNLGNLYRVRRIGGRWRAPVLLGRPRVAFMSDIIVDTIQPNWIWVTYSAINGGHVYFSPDGGANWQNRSSNLPNIPINAVVTDPKNSRHVYVGGDNGVYRTTNAGTSWVDFSRALPNAIVGDLLFHAKKRVLRAGTRNRGVWQLRL